jgi:pSer/pThr/pTyr-binding forkhead associated (FHA) protein
MSGPTRWDRSRPGPPIPPPVPAPFPADDPPELDDRARNTLQEWPPKVAIAGSLSNEASFGKAVGGLTHSMPEVGRLPFKSERVRSRRVVRIVSRGEDGLSIELQAGVNRIGRQRQGNHIVLVSPDVSRHHAEIEVRSDAILLRDTGSANGSYINGSRVTGDREVRPGDLLAFSDQFEFQVLVDLALEPPETFTVPSSEHLPSTGEQLAPPPRLLSPAAMEETLSDEQPTPLPDGVDPTALRTPDELLHPPSRSRLHEGLAPALARTLDPEDDPTSIDEDGLAGGEKERLFLATLLQLSKRCMAAGDLGELDHLLMNVLERVVVFDRGFLAYELRGGDWKLLVAPRGTRFDRAEIRSLLERGLDARRPLLGSRPGAEVGSALLGQAAEARVLVPLRTPAAKVGVLFLESRTPRPFDKKTVEFLASFCDVAALAIHTHLG